ncbi:hypothetical protein AAE02nite_35790 [Adhaeribacter aerolatus]|uniref:Serine protease n=1 Tax=Adhaeribacter aerolatus TaxID=670289 RepID=A0A512B1S8_9BACT|nr:serine protease [Adhaeribacter aerolatus]GEO05915.1 hypothetical protein AAE02nite_35790 [Adhaeribacter aerolatus]
MGIPTEILKFFKISNAKTDASGVIRPFAIHDLFKEHSSSTLKGVRLEYVYSICKKFEHEGLLISAGTNGTAPLMNQCYYNMWLEEDLANYGAYDFLIEGFLSIRNNFSTAVMPIVVQHSETGIIDIGTSFVYQRNLILTARHCVENMDYIKILKGTEVVKVKRVLYPRNRKIDLAIIETEDGALNNIPFFHFDKGNVLDDVLTLGYPPISGFDAIQFSEKGTINTMYKASIGDIVGEDISYLDGVDYFLINARVKGGNSGGPVINKFGAVVGMLTQLPYDMENPDRIDLMGFGIALPTEVIDNILKSDELDEFATENTLDGFKIVEP